MNVKLAGYEAEYFLPTVREVLDPRLAEHGFRYAGDHRGVTAYWASDGQFFRVGYLPETTPRYELLLGVGESESTPLEPKSSSNSIGVWRLLPADVAPEIANWRFDSPQALRDELLRAWEEVVVPFVVPILNGEDELARLIAEHSDEITDEGEQLMDERLLRHARSEFDAGRFAEASHAYDELGGEALTQADRKRARIARQRR
ncbi:MAG: hypothetical protein QOE69_2521 [Thermoleophilaceae bacterium]|jgi:hypothetical protein|nr:hypothetical protein [Thermoleophilaceae bacterium]